MKRCLLCLSLAATMYGQTPVPTPDPTAVVGTVDGKDFTVADIQKLLATAEPGFTQAFQLNPQDAVSKILFLQYLSAEADKRKLMENSAVKQQVDAAVVRLLREAVVDDEGNNYPVSNEAVEAFYNEHKAQFQQTKIKVIYIGFKSDTPLPGTSTEAIKAAAQAAIGVGVGQHSEPEARALAIDVVKKLRDGLDFAKAVAQYSEDLTSREAGGDYGIIKIDSPYPEDFRKAVLALKPGDISDPIRQPAGYYIIRGEETTAQPMTELITNIVNVIRKDHMNDWLKQKTEQFKLTTKDPKLLQSIGAPGAPPPLLAR